MVIGNTATNSLAGTSYSQPTAASGLTSPATTTSSSSGGGDSVHLSATAEATGYKQQGLSISQIASLMGVTSAQVDSYLYITPVAATGAVGGGGGGAVASTAPAKGGGGSAPASAAASTTATTKPAASSSTTTSTATTGTTSSKSVAIPDLKAA